MNARLLRGLLFLCSVLILVASFAPAAFAGEDEDDNGDNGDNGGAVGGVETGVGGMASPGSDGSMVLPIALAGGGALVLTAAGGLALRRRTSE